MPIPALVWAGVTIASTVYGAMSRSAQQRQAANQQSGFQEYNALEQYRVTNRNITSQLELGLFNARMSMAAGAAQASAISATTNYNVAMIMATTMYNDLLYQEELELLWSAHDLDQILLERARALERGGIIAKQAASGTVIGEGSNADVVVAQMTEGALESEVVRRNASNQAARITNEEVQGLWRGQAEALKVGYEGQVAAWSAMQNAKYQAAGSLASTFFGAKAAKESAEYALESGMMGANFTQINGRDTARNTLTSGLFNAAGQGAQIYYGNRVPQIASESTPGTSVNYQIGDPESNYWSFFGS